MTRFISSFLKKLTIGVKMLFMSHCRTVSKLARRAIMRYMKRLYFACCSLRNKQRKRTAGVLFLISGCLLLILNSKSDSCYLDSCWKVNRDRSAQAPFSDRSTFVTTFPQRQWKNASVKRILRWTGFFNDMTWEETDDRYFAPCEQSQCTMTNDRSLIGESDAVLFHAMALFNYWRGFPMPDQRTPDQVWILYNVEPPTHTPLNLKRFAGVFNWTAWHRLDSDVPVAYGGYTKKPHDDCYGHNHTVNLAREKLRFAAWISSNCIDYSRRQLFVRRLKEALGDDLDLYGACGGKPCPQTTCYDTVSNYKFFFAFENTNCRDYISEKFWNSLTRQQIPIVMGGAASDDYRKVAPPNSFLHVYDFPSIEDLVQQLRSLSQDEAAYNSYLAWTRKYDVYSELSARRKWWCQLCKALHDKEHPAQVYRDLHGWVADDTCPQWTLMNQIGRYIDGWKIKFGLL